MRTFYLSILALLAVAVVTATLMAPEGPAAASEDESEVMFSHELHQELAACADCHSVEDSEVLSDQLSPTPETCTSCHEEENVRTYWGLDESASLTMVAEDTEPEELIFSHKYHTGTINMECATCHMLMDDEMSNPTMESCYTCHNNGERMAPIFSTVDHEQPYTATNQCEACHANLFAMTPENHRTIDWDRLHGKMAMNGEADRECAACHSQSFCQECHTPTNSVPSPNASDDFYVEGWARGEKMDDSRMLTLQKAHTLTYRYTHGFDARVQSNRCATCHDHETFCVECHHNGYDGNGARIVPQTHQMAGWASPTGGRAMNRHGRLATMDIERCATCHHVEGGDPVCAMCHSTGIAGGEDE